MAADSIITYRQVYASPLPGHTAFFANQSGDTTVVADQVPACGAAGPVVFVIDPEAHAVLLSLIDSPADGLEHFLGQVIGRETVHGVDVEIEDACAPRLPQAGRSRTT